MSNETSATCQNVEEITLNELNTIISVLIADEKTELCEINKLSLTTRTKLAFMHQDNLERTNARLMQ